MRPLFPSCRQAYTILELLASITVVAIISATVFLFIPSYINSATKTANENTLITLNSALMDYRVSGGLSNAHSLGGTNTTAKIIAILDSFKTGFTAGGRRNIFLNTSTPINPAHLYATGSGKTFQFIGYGVTIAGADNSGFAGTYAPPGTTPPTATISASPTSGTTPLDSTLTWSSTDSTAATVTLDGSTISTATAGSYSATGLTTGTHTSSVSVTGPGGSASASATITVSALAAPTATISASPTSGTTPLSSTITWSSTDATSASVTLDGSAISTATSGSYSATGLITGTHTATIVVAGPGGSNSASATITVSAAPAPTATISASPASGTAPLSSTITWSSTNATSGSLAIDGGEVGTGTSGTYSATGLAAGTHTVAISVSGPGGSVSNSTTITVSAPAAPTATISASPASGTTPLSSTITWSSTDATAATVTLDGVTISSATSGTYSATGLTTGTHTAAISVTGPGGSGSNSTTITVSDGLSGPWKYFKLTVTKRNTGTVSSIQMAEFVFKYNGTDVAWPSGTTITALHPSVAYYNGTTENITKFIDGVLTTKYCDIGFDGNTSSTTTSVVTGSAIALITIGSSQSLTVNGYNMYNANDTSAYPGRVPVSWTLEGSNDNSTWTTLHTITNNTPVITTNNTWIGPWSF